MAEAKANGSVEAAAPTTVTFPQLLSLNNDNDDDTDGNNHAHNNHHHHNNYYHDHEGPHTISIMEEPFALPPASSQVWAVGVRSALCGCANISTDSGRRHIAILILVISVIPVLGLFLQNAFEVKVNLGILASSGRVRQDVLFSTETGNLIHFLQIERGTSALFISSRGEGGESGLTSLNERRQATDDAMTAVTEWINQHYTDQNSGVRHIRDRNYFLDDIRAFREKVTSLNATVPENMEFYSAHIESLIEWVVESLRQYGSSALWSRLVGYHMLILGKDWTGMERALGSTFFAHGGFSESEMAAYLEKKTLSQTYLRRFWEYTKETTLLEEHYNGSPLEATILRMRSVIQSNNVPGGPDVEMAQWWFDNMTLYINILKHVQDHLTQSIVDDLDEEMNEKTNNLVISVSVMVSSVVLLAFVVYSIRRLTRRLQAFAFTLQLKTQALTNERRKSDWLLNQMMPVSVAERLKKNLPVEPEVYRAVTIFFSDIVGFTGISARSSPLQVIAMLNKLYQAIDNITDLYLVYKVETIGDAYMIASGLPTKNEEGHAREMAELALELRDTVCNMTVPHIPDQLICLRIGLNSGPVACGIVGSKMPRYCLFGDTVNVASRMESTGLPAKIHISGSTHRELRKFEGFVMEERGLVDVKGKGKMRTYILVDKTPCCHRKMPSTPQDRT